MSIKTFPSDGKPQMIYHMIRTYFPVFPLLTIISVRPTAGAVHAAEGAGGPVAVVRNLA